ncbi:MAG: hypothetical protein WC868_06370 [Bacteroidales bacterium]
MIKKIFIVFFLLVCGAFRVSDVVLLRTITGLVSFITTDNIGCLYIISGNELAKYDVDGNLLKTYSNKAYGNISFVDASDPLKILLYYRDFRIILFLEKMLSESGDPILLDNLGVVQPTLVCNSYENGFWIYDQQNFQLIRFNKNLQVSNQSGNIVQITDKEIKPNFLIEINNIVYLNDPVNGILIFDKYGTYAKILPFKNLNSFQIFDDNIIYSTESQLIQYNFKTFEQKSMNLPEKNVIGTRYEKNKLYIQDTVAVNIYSVK